MTAVRRLNVWMTTTLGELTNLGSEDGLTVGDFGLIDTAGLYVCATAAVSTSTWHALVRIPFTGRWAVGAKNVGAAATSVYMQVGVSFAGQFAAAPSSVTITTDSNLSWPTALTASSGVDGIWLSGFSASIVAGAIAWRRGTYSAS
jgi:hypothetical protein